MIETLQDARQHQLVILRRLVKGPLTEFELSSEIARHSGYSDDEALMRVREWLIELRDEGLVWAGALSNDMGQEIFAAALTRRGREVAA
ncbi:MAG: hypothetical protein HUU22_00590 [Phycisphaerae bacterium]|nr:hypothetical protein [Phycisphaerae bacterium]NUQ44511.1 hypothetical protein [Phycisphaerae bacterium]